MRKEKNNHHKTLKSVAMVVLIFTVLIVGVWQLIQNEFVKTDLPADEAVIENQSAVSHLAIENEDESPTVVKADLPVRKALDKMELYKGLHQYQTTGFTPLFIYKTRPAESLLTQDIQQVNVPLLNQKDYRWAFSTYGDDSGSIIAANGCAIVSLAMVDSYFQNKLIDPGEIAQWAGLDHYVTYAGTAFTIYDAFGKERGYEVKEFYDFYEAMEEVKAGKPVVVGINPGYFSSVGHVMVIRGYEDGKVYINDPNDDMGSQASLVGHDEEYMIQEGIAYWSFSN